MSRRVWFCQKHTPDSHHQRDDADDDPRSKLVEVFDEGQTLVELRRLQAGHLALVLYDLALDRLGSGVGVRVTAALDLGRFVVVVVLA